MLLYVAFILMRTKFLNSDMLINKELNISEDISLC